MMRAHELKVGSVYFGFSCENDDHMRLMIDSYEYLGRNREPPGDVGDYLFRYLDSEDEVVFSEGELKGIFDLPGLIEALSRIRDGTFPKTGPQAPSKDHQERKS
jgi:hypothetical protein